MTGPRIPARVWLATLGRLFAVQGSWNYELLLGNGIGFAAEPALRLLPGGRGGDRYKAAIARQSRYFNAHPYLASIAVGSLVRAELEGIDAQKIERFRTALAGPLGSLGDRLVWAGWLPLCSLVAMVCYGLGASPLVTVVVFLAVFNVGHVALRAWGLRVGFARGLNVAGALGAPLLRRTPEWVDRAGALVAGVAIPSAVERALGVGGGLAAVGVIGVLVAGGAAFAYTPNKSVGWRIALGLVAILVLYAVLA